MSRKQFLIDFYVSVIANHKHHQPLSDMIGFNLRVSSLCVIFLWRSPVLVALQLPSVLLYSMSYFHPLQCITIQFLI